MPKRRRDADLGTYFRVPNNPDGWAFIRHLRHYSTAGTRFKIRGRGPRVKHAIADNRAKWSYRQDLPIIHAAELVIYVTRSRFKELPLERYHELKAIESNVLQAVLRITDRLKATGEMWDKKLAIPMSILEFKRRRIRI